MVDLILKDRDGKDQIFPGVEPVRFRLADGTSQVFNLVPEGVEIGGSGTAPVLLRGEFTPTATGTDIVVAHNMGILPDMIIAWCRSGASGYVTAMDSLSGALREALGDGANGQIYYWTSSGLTKGGLLYNHEDTMDKTEQIAVTIGRIHSVTPKNFTLTGGTSWPIKTGVAWDYVALGGLVKHADYLYITLALDGVGSLTVSGGAPEIAQLEIYVDGVLAKTVEYVHGDEVCIDVSDTASDVLSHTVSVVALGDGLTDKYPYIWYEPVTGIVTPTASGVCGADARWTYDSRDGSLTISGTGPMADCVAGEQPWLGYASAINEITIEDGITHIGAQSCRETSAAKLTIPDSVTSIGKSAFYGNTNLTSVTVPASVTEMDIYVLGGCTALTSVELQEGLSLIGGYMFYNCTGLTSITIPDTVTSIGEYAFSGSGLTSVYIPDGVTTFGGDGDGYGQTFRNCTALTEVRLPAGLTTIPGCMFYSCTALTSITIPETVTKIGDYAFRGSGLTSVTIPAATSSIGKYAFYATSLTSATFNNKTGWGCGTSAGFKTYSVSYSTLSSTSSAATYLKSSYAKYYWTRS